MKLSYLTPVAVDLKRIHGTEQRMVNDAVLVDSRADFRRHCEHSIGQAPGTERVQVVHDGGAGFEVAGEHHVGGDEELEDRGVVRGAEGGADESCAPCHWVAETAVGGRFRRAVGLAIHGVARGCNVAIWCVGAYSHGVDCVQYHLDRVHPGIFFERPEVVGGFVVLCRQLHEARQRVKLPFTIESLFLVVSEVEVVAVVGAIGPGGDFGFWYRLECVTVGGKFDVAGVGIDNATNESRE